MAPPRTSTPLGNRESGRSSSLSRVTTTSSTDPDVASPQESLLKSPELRDVDSSDSDLDEEEDLAALEESTVMRPEDEAAMLAYERAQKIFEEEQEEAESRAEKERERKDRSRSRGGPASRNASRRRESNEEGGGAAVLGLLAQLDRGIK